MFIAELFTITRYASNPSVHLQMNGYRSNIYVCVYVCVCVWTCVHLYVCIYIYIYLYIHTMEEIQAWSPMLSREFKNKN